MHSSAIMPAVTWCVSGSDCTMSSPWIYIPLKLPSTASSSMLVMRRPGSRSSLTPHRLLVELARRVVRHVAVARIFVRERAHVARALHVVLAAQRVYADALAADVAGGHGEVCHAHHHGRALRMLGDAEAVEDAGVLAPRCIHPRGTAQILRVHADDVLPAPRASAEPRRRSAPRIRNRSSSQRSFTKAFRQSSPSVTITCAHRVDEGDVGAGLQRQVVLRPGCAAT